MVEAEKQKIRKEYERKESQVEVKKKKMCVSATRRSLNLAPWTGGSNPCPGPRPAPTVP